MNISPISLICRLIHHMSPVKKVMFCRRLIIRDMVVGFLCFYLLKHQKETRHRITFITLLLSDIRAIGDPIKRSGTFQHYHFWNFDCYIFRTLEKMEMKSKKIIIVADIYSNSLNTRNVHYIDLRLDDLSKRFYGIAAPRELLLQRSIKISQNLADMDIPALLTVADIYSPSMNQMEWHIWLKTTDVGWITYQIEGGEFI